MVFLKIWWCFSCAYKMICPVTVASFLFEIRKQQFSIKSKNQLLLVCVTSKHVQFNVPLVFCVSALIVQHLNIRGFAISWF